MSDFFDMLNDDLPSKSGKKVSFLEEDFDDFDFDDDDFESLEEDSFDDDEEFDSLLEEEEPEFHDRILESILEGLEEEYSDFSKSDPGTPDAASLDLSDPREQSMYQKSMSSKTEDDDFDFDDDDDDFDDFDDLDEGCGSKVEGNGCRGCETEGCSKEEGCGKSEGDEYDDYSINNNDMDLLSSLIDNDPTLSDDDDFDVDDIDEKDVALVRLFESIVTPYMLKEMITEDASSITQEDIDILIEEGFLSPSDLDYIGFTEAQNLGKYKNTKVVVKAESKFKRIVGIAERLLCMKYKPELQKKIDLLMVKVRALKKGRKDKFHNKAVLMARAYQKRRAKSKSHYAAGGVIPTEKKED